MDLGASKKPNHLVQKKSTSTETVHEPKAGDKTVQLDWLRYTSTEK
jgi:hypothetical protein